MARDEVRSMSQICSANLSKAEQISAAFNDASDSIGADSSNSGNAMKNL